MDKQAYLDEVYNEAYNDEISKLATPTRKRVGEAIANRKVKVFPKHNNPQAQGAIEQIARQGDELAKRKGVISSKPVKREIGSTGVMVNRPSERQEALAEIAAIKAGTKPSPKGMTTGLQMHDKGGKAYDKVRAAITKKIEPNLKSKYNKANKALDVERAAQGRTRPGPHYRSPRFA